MDDANVLIAFGLTLFAGLSTGIGSILAFFTKRTNTRFLSVALGFSAGVMLYVSFIEIFGEAKEALIGTLGLKGGSWATVAAFFGGILFIGLIDSLVPSEKNPHEAHKVEELKNCSTCSDQSKLMRTGLFTALAIAIHNVPEGIAVSIPIFYASGNRKNAFWLSFLSGLAQLSAI